MDINEAVKNRRSIRRFLSERVPEELIRELISDALWAPSWGNTQQYEFVVATGDALERFKKENREALMSGEKPEPDVPMPEKWPETLKKRYVDVGKSVLTSFSIAREDKIGRTNYYGDMFSLFNATALLIVEEEHKKFSSGEGSGRNNPGTHQRCSMGSIVGEYSAV